MRVAAAGEELFGQWDQRDPGAERLIRIDIDGTGSRRPDHRAAKNLLHANAGGTGEYELMSRSTFSAKGVVTRVLSQQTSIVRLRREVAGCGEAVEREVVPFRAFQRVVAL